MARPALSPLKSWQPSSKRAPKAFSELLRTEATYSSGIFLKKMPPFTAGLRQFRKCSKISVLLFACVW